MVLPYVDSPDELKSCNKKDLVKRLYKITGLSTSAPSYKIELTFHEEARPSSDIIPKFGAYSSGNEIAPKIVMRYTQFRALVEGVDFELSDTGELNVK